MTHRKGPIDRVNCCHRVLGHRASRITSHRKGPLLVMNVFHFPSVACGDVTTLHGECASFFENKSLLYRARQHNTTAYEVLKGVMHSHSGVGVCRTGKVDSLPRHLHYHPSVGRHSSRRLEQHTPGERKLVAYLAFSSVYVLRNCQTYCHTFAQTLTKFLFPLWTCFEFSGPYNSKTECAAITGIMG